MWLTDCSPSFIPLNLLDTVNACTYFGKCVSFCEHQEKYTVKPNFLYYIMISAV